ncbi:MAG: hypothetical protein ACOH2J_10505 [Allorhizobium sp.]
MMRVRSKSIEAQFHAEMLAVYDSCAALGFRPVLLRRMIILKGGANAARELIFQPGATGLERLAEMQKSEMSMEAIMTRPEFQALFSALEIKEATKRLAGTAQGRSRGRLIARVTTT